MSCILFPILLTLQAPSEEAPSFRKRLLSVTDNLRVETWRTDGVELGIATETPWSLRKETLHGGRQEGVDRIVIDNGRLRITVIPTRGMSVLEVVAGDLRLGWDSPVKEVVHPNTIDLQARGGLGWLEGFNEWMVRCGLEWAGHPGTDRFTNNVGDEATMELTLHGRVGNLPASEVEVVVDRDPPHRIRVRGRVDERSFYGPQLELWAEVSTVPGTEEFRIEDRLTNRGGAEQEFQMIYHANHGPPLLEEGARFVGPIQRVTPFNDHAAAGVASYDVYPAPTAGFVEQVYCLVPYADQDGRTRILLHNAAGDRAVSFAYAVSQLPYLTLWKNALDRTSGYVTGVEPGTSYPYNRRIERQAGRVPRLGPGESRHFAIDFAVHRNAAEVSRVVAAIEHIQGDRPTRVEERPAPDD